MEKLLPYERLIVSYIDLKWNNNKIEIHILKVFIVSYIDLKWNNNDIRISEIKSEL